MLVMWFPIQQKTYDAAIGDFTILAERLQYVDFTVPYVDSGMAMIVPAKSTGSALVFTKPFTWDMWVVTGVILMYTTLIVCFLERQSNPEFSGSWKNQISTALWFTLSSLFFAHSINFMYKTHDIMDRLLRWHCCQLLLIYYHKIQHVNCQRDGLNLPKKKKKKLILNGKKPTL